MAAIGVLALQGAFAAHLAALRALGHTAVEVRYPRQLDEVDGLVLPGGESTTHLHLIARTGFDGPLRGFAASGRPILATCAGLILAAARVRDPEQESFGWLPVTVRRNGWGRQLESFCAESDAGVPGDDRDPRGSSPVPLVLIRAPRIADPGDAEVLLRYRGEPVLVRSGRVVGATFHPELTSDHRVHALTFGEA